MLGFSLAGVVVLRQREPSRSSFRFQGSRERVIRSDHTLSAVALIVIIDVATNESVIVFSLSFVGRAFN